MFYWLKRSDSLVRYEARKGDGGFYELAVTDESGQETIETFPAEASLHARQIEFERELVAQGWSGPYGWHV